MMPNGNPPHKRNHSQADVKHRMEMLRLAIDGIPYLKLCDLEQSGKSYHYTYETMSILNQTYPDHQFYFIMGADSLFDFDEWREPGIICRECILLAATRDHCRRDEILRRIEELHEKFDADIRVLNTPNMDVASEEIRKRIRSREDVSDMLPEDVEGYIRRNHLYE